MVDPSWRTHSLVAGAEVDTEGLLHREWLLTNGTGAFAAGTVLGCNTRRYHGLLIAAMIPPVRRVVALNQMWEQLVLRPRSPGADEANEEGSTLQFTTMMFHSRDDARPLWSPRGHTMLRRFDRGLSVSWSYGWKGIGCIRELFLHWKQQAATIRYCITGLDRSDVRQATFRLHPMLTLRDMHGLLRQATARSFKTTVSHGGSTLRVQRDAAVVTFNCQGATFKPNEHWWHDLWYPVETERGQDDSEDLFVPGAFEADLTPSPEVELILTVTLGQESANPMTQTRTRATHLQRLIDRLPSLEIAGPSAPGGQRSSGDPLARCLVIAADDFVVDRSSGDRTLATILAGYPWFADWGRDAFVALPGLLLCTGRIPEAAAVLRVFADSVVNGLVPNCFDDVNDEAAHYNSADASLWFVNAALAYHRVSRDVSSWHNWLGAAVTEIVHAYIQGTRHGIALAADGLVTAGGQETQLTWMDAKVGDRVFTPRPGKTVEINALWYNALVGLSQTPDPTSAPVEPYRDLAARAKHSFSRLFWNEQQQCLFDHIWTDTQGNSHRDSSIRPNQIFAVSLPHSPLGRTRRALVLRTMRDRLLTPFGLRTLPVDDPNYHGRYTGDQYHRDKAYHQGTVWPWLIGPYAEAVLRLGRFSAKARAEARTAIDPLLIQLAADGSATVGQLHEIHEADPPHRPVGCFAQAWSVAELLRVLQLIGTGP